MGPLPALVLAAVLATIATALRSLTLSGTAAATAVGTMILIGAGWPGGVVLLAFFATSSLLGRVFPPTADPLDFKGERRDAAQVLANGVTAGIGATAGLVDPGLGLWLVAAPLAAATADTWATVIGQASGARPVDLVTRAAVQPGTSGGVTIPGSLAGVAGAAFIGLTAAALARNWLMAPAATLLGAGSMMFDSWLGSRLQARFECAACATVREGPRCHCGAAAIHSRGLRWLRNDAVNLISTAAASLAGLGLWWSAF